jgi:NADH dehydrogenase FAD-containing subunit
VPDLAADGVRLVERATVSAIGPSSVTVRTEAGEEEIPADTVVVTDAVTPRTALAEALAAAGIAVRVVGDAGGLRNLEGANLDAAEVALALA